MDEKRLVIANYLSPDFPIDMFLLLKDYLAKELEMAVYLVYEDRLEENLKPFSGFFDVGFVSTLTAAKLRHDSAFNVDVLPIAPVYKHSKNQLNPVYYSDIIFSTGKKNIKYVQLEDLRGHNWSYSHDNSLSGALYPLEELKRLGFDSTFFGHTTRTNSHAQSIRNVIDGVSDSAAINSVTLNHYFQTHHEVKPAVEVLTSLGPIPSPPVVIRSTLDGCLKTGIQEALKNLPNTEYGKKLKKFGLLGFASIDLLSHFMPLDKIHSFEDGLKMSSIYY